MNKEELLQEGLDATQTIARLYSRAAKLPDELLPTQLREQQEDLDSVDRFILQLKLDVAAKFILRYLRQRGPATIGQIYMKLNFGNGLIYQAVEGLVELGAIIESGETYERVYIDPDTNQTISG
jgi:hypothetical protein